MEKNQRIACVSNGRSITTADPPQLHFRSFGSTAFLGFVLMKLDIGAQGLKPLFIAGCCVTTIFLDLAFAAERYLRHTGRLAKNLGRAEKVLSGLSSAF